MYAADKSNAKGQRRRISKIGTREERGRIQRRIRGQEDQKNERKVGAVKMQNFSCGRVPFRLLVDLPSKLSRSMSRGPGPMLFAVAQTVF